MCDQQRLERDLKEIEEMPNVKLSFPEEGDKTQFIVSVKVRDGFYRDKYLKFKFTLDDNWPNRPPKVVAVDKIWHPNIGFNRDNYSKNAHIDLSFLGHDYKPTILLSMIVEGIKFLLTNINPHDALNQEAANQYLNNIERFKRTVEEYMDEIDDDSSS